MNRYIRVTNLPRTTTDDQLTEFFGQFGEVINAYVNLKASGKLKGFVTFRTEEVAKALIERKDKLKLEGNKLTIKASLPKKEKHISNEIFVNNLSIEITDDQLAEFFSTFGEVKEACVVRDVSGQSRSSGFVTFSTREVAQALFEREDALELEGNKLNIKALLPKNEKHISNEIFVNNLPTEITDNQLVEFFNTFGEVQEACVIRGASGQSRGFGNEIFVNNLPIETTDDQLAEFFSTFGEVKKACVVREASGQSRGFGFVTFSTREVAKGLIEREDTLELEGKKLRINVSIPKDVRHISKKVFVKNLPNETTDDQLAEFFGTFGEVQKAYVIRDATGQSRGFGFVTFVNVETAMTVVKRKSLSLLVKANSSSKLHDLKLKPTNIPEFFGHFGKIKKARVVRNTSGQSKGFGFVRFSDEEIVKALIERKEPILLGEKHLIIELLENKNDEVLLETNEPDIEENKIPFRASKNKEERQPISSDICVKNIPFSTTNDQLADFFSRFGEVKDARVIHGASGKQKGFGFVAFENKEIVNTLLDKEEPLVLGDRKLDLVDKRKETNNITSTKYFVRNIDFDITDDQLFEYFSTFGRVKETHILRRSSGQSRGIGSVNFANVKIARDVIEREETLILGGRRLFIENFQLGTQQNVIVRVNNIPKGKKDYELFDFFKTFGKVLKSPVIRKLSRESADFAYITFAKEKTVKALIERDDPIIFDKRELLIEDTRENGLVSKVIYVRGLPYGTTDEHLIQTFSIFGEVTKASVFYLSSGKPKKCGLVIFADLESAKAVFKRKMPIKLGNNTLIVHVSRPEKIRMNKTKVYYSSNVKTSSRSKSESQKPATTRRRSRTPAPTMPRHPSTPRDDQILFTNYKRSLPIEGVNNPPRNQETSASSSRLDSRTIRNKSISERIRRPR
ncbi:hypothetical protein LAZ67_6001535, partial [Cordylochernes scorpioides]